MHIEIENLAKLGRTDIALDGITVITGENDTGKSTIGKVLFAVFNALNEIDGQIADIFIDQVLQLRMTFHSKNLDNIFYEKQEIQKFRPQIRRQICKLLKQKDIIDENMFRSVVESFLDDQEMPRLVMEDRVSYGREPEKPLKAVRLSKLEIIQEIISRYFTSVFHSQINSLQRPDTQAVVKLVVDGKKLQVAFENHQCTSYTSEVEICHKAIYIDNPFVLDTLHGGRGMSETDRFLIKLLESDGSSELLDGVLDSVSAKDKLKEIDRILQPIIDGRIMEQSDGSYLKSNAFKAPVSLSNLSAGLKSFVILKMLLERGRLKSGDVVILDEPEIHLHPQWQIAYAEIIVLLQKFFGLFIVVTTHSPYFLDAIDLFSVKHGIDKEVNYYLASANGESVEFEKVTHEIDAIYKKMASPIQMLDTLRYELNQR